MLNRIVSNCLGEKNFKKEEIYNLNTHAKLLRLQIYENNLYVVDAEYLQNGQMEQRNYSICKMLQDVLKNYSVPKMQQKPKRK
jgi:hypothetical protein